MITTIPFVDEDCSQQDEGRAEKERALLQAFTQHRPQLIAYCRALGISDSDIEDALQEAWIIGADKIDHLRKSKAVTAWVRKILWSRSINRRLRRREWVVHDEEGLWEKQGRWGETSVEENPLEILIEEERARLLRTAVSELRPVDRSALDAFYLRDLSIKEVAAEAERPIGTIKRRLHDGRKRLRDSLPPSLLEQEA